MKSITCPTCDGSKKQKIVAQMWNAETRGFDPQPPVYIGCVRCKGLGHIEPDQLLKEAAEDECWCKCDKDHGVTYHPDGNTNSYNGGFACSKHHYSCNNCNKIVQIG